MRPDNGIYGEWAGFRGHPEDQTKCVEEIWNGPRGMTSSQCSRKRGKGPDGLWCKQHGKLEERRQECARIYGRPKKVTP